MERIVLSTIVYRPPSDVFTVVRDFEAYPSYAKYLQSVTRHGTGGVGTRYDLTFAWWVLTHTVRSEVTEIDAPRQISWRLRSDIDALGEWRLEALGDSPSDADVEPPNDEERLPDNDLHLNGDPPSGGDPLADGDSLPASDPLVDGDPLPDGVETGTRLWFTVEYDPRTANRRILDLPRFLSVDRVIDRIKPRLYDEAEGVVRRLVAPVEGTERPVELIVHEAPGSDGREVVGGDSIGERGAGER